MRAMMVVVPVWFGDEVIMLMSGIDGESTVVRHTSGSDSGLGERGHEGGIGCPSWTEECAALR